MAKSRDKHTCAFCGAEPGQKKGVFFIPSMYDGLDICSECVCKGYEIISDVQGRKNPAKGKNSPIADLNVPSPQKIKAELDRFVIGQEQAKRFFQLRSTITTPV